MQKQYVAQRIKDCISYRKIITNIFSHKIDAKIHNYFNDIIKPPKEIIGNIPTLFKKVKKMVQNERLDQHFFHIPFYHH